jgi:ADP-heptose:LPS heptosyltransferase
VGVGDVWKTRQYHFDQWLRLAEILLEEGYEVVMLGGQAEDEMNKKIALQTGAKYFGVGPISEFIATVNKCDLMVTCVTLGLHIAIGLQKKVVLLNNIFNKHEFYLYNKGIILEPPLPCTMCYKTRFDDRCEAANCMDLIRPPEIVNAVNTLMYEEGIRGR